MMKRLRIFLIGMLFLGIPLMLNAPGAAAGDILAFDRMAGVPEDEFAIRGINGGGAPWVVDVATGSLSEDGDLEITVRGLVLRDTGLNPSAAFTGIVSCLEGLGVETNVSTAPFPTDEAGDADIKETLILPNPCFAPMVFVVGNSGNWFAVTGGGPDADRADVDAGLADPAADPAVIEEPVVDDALQ
jgi:hypothetical protein